MIYKLNSKQMMERLTSSQEALEDMENQISVMDSEMVHELAIVSNMQEYAVEQLACLREQGGATRDAQNRIVFTKADILDGLFEHYGTTIHPAFIKEPTNVFNFGTAGGWIFKNNATVFINDAVKEGYKFMLMHDSISEKRATFEEFDEPNLTLKVKVNPDDLLGSTDFNIIELLPCIPGSFDITDIRVYTMQDYHRANTSVPTVQLANTIASCGASRIMIGEMRTLYKCEIDIRLNFQNTHGKYPFGVRHLYFLKGNYDPDSYVLVRLKHDKFIDWISEDVLLRDQNGVYESTCTDEKIKLFMSYVANTPAMEIATSVSEGENPIPRNVKEIFVRIPVLCSMVSMGFKTVKDR